MLLTCRVPILRDNYVWLLLSPESGESAVIDPGVAAPPLAALRDMGGRLTHILNTHHHIDHVGGNLEIQRQTGCVIAGPAAESEKIPGLQQGLRGGDTLQVCGETASILATPGHTLGHICWWFPASGILFCGDTLFALGCGRLSEGTPEMMWDSLRALRTVPDHTLLYCAHEYTCANARFACTVDPDNPALAAYAATVTALRAVNRATVPFPLGREKAANPFLRADDPALARALDIPNATGAAVFAALRRQKDGF